MVLRSRLVCPILCCTIPRMKYIPTGTSGLCASLGIPLLVWSVVNRRTRMPFGTFSFVSPNDSGFEARLQSHVRAVEYFLGILLQNEMDF